MDNDVSQAQPVTQFPPYHWFGYYDMPCWDISGRYLLSLGVPFQERPPTPDDVAAIGMTDLETGEYIALSETHAFNWQQGAMLHWLPAAPDRQIIYNDRRDDRFVSVVLDVFGGEQRVLGRPTSDVGLGGRWAASLNFARIAQTRPGYGYAGLADPHAGEPHPREDGLWVIDMASGEGRLVVSMHDIYDYLDRPPYLETAKMWFNHTLFNTTETRLAFLVRWRNGPSWQTRMFVVDPDGHNLRMILPGPMVSHYDWRNEQEILAWATLGGEDHFYLINDVTGEYEAVGPELLTQDGHCSYSHNGRWILTDTYPAPPSYERTLKIYIPAENREVVVGRYVSPPPFVGEIRCDLHPRWSRDDRLICFDSVHEGHRQVYVVKTPALD
jgi:hypothetical protein